jgi:site-specific DNA-methyltransferase (adenine-specific)
LNGLNSESVDLVYLDPPFNSKRLYNATIGSRAEGSQFKDTWKWSDVNEYQLDIIANDFPELADYIEIIDRVSDMSMKAYITYMAQRVIQLHRILKPTGSIYYHCDPTAGHFVKLMLDCVFGKENFRNEIVWCYDKWTAPSKRQLQRNHDTIYYYSKTNKVYFNVLKEIDSKRQITIDRGYTTNLLKDGTRQLIIYEGSENKDNIKSLMQKEKFKNILIRKKDELGKPLKDWWTINIIHPKAKERTGYPTQKPLALLERIIKASCPEGGIVLDPFCGCATTCVAAQRLKRHWIGIDIEDKAVDLLIERLEQDGNLRDTEISQLDLKYKEVQLDLKYKEAGKEFIVLNCEKDENKLPHRTDIETKNIDEPKTKLEIKKFLYQKQQHKCNGCGREFPIDLFDIDHIVPKACGGGDYLENYQLLCRTCNTTKGARPMEFLLQRIDLIRKKRREIEY